MTEKVTCPYCGAEMEYDNIEDYNTVWAYQCRKCYSSGPQVLVGGHCKEKEPEARELALRRAEPENRVLTRDEVENLPCDTETGGDPVYVERRFKNDCWAMPVCINEPCGEYGVTWRCWLRKPTEKEKRATPWD